MFSVASRRGGLPEKNEPGRCSSHDAAPIHILPCNESTIICKLPNREFGARCTPCVHHRFVAPLAARQPFEEIENQSFDGFVSHRSLLSLALLRRSRSVAGAVRNRSYRLQLNRWPGAGFF